MSLAKYSLNIYEPKTFEIEETLESNGLLWGDYVDIVEKSQVFKGQTDDDTLIEYFNYVEDAMFRIFPELNKDKIKKASADEMMSIFRNVIALGNRFKSNNSKN